jgi:hypothetical protein
MRSVSAQNRFLALAAALLIVQLAPGALTAQEIVVKNDTVTEFGSAVFVGDFVPGEKAGWMSSWPEACPTAAGGPGSPTLPPPGTRPLRQGITGSPLADDRVQ